MSPSTSLQQKMYLLARQRDLFEQAKAYAYDYLESVFDRNVFPSEAALAGLKAFDEPLPPTPGDPTEMLRMLHAYGSPGYCPTTTGEDTLGW